MPRIDTSPRHKNAPRPAWKVAKSYFAWLRGRNCTFANADCRGKIEAAHTPDPQSKGTATKAADFNAIPACAFHHQLQTVQGWSAVGLTREAAAGLAALYWYAWPGRTVWEREQANAQG